MMGAEPTNAAVRYDANSRCLLSQRLSSVFSSFPFYSLAPDRSDRLNLLILHNYLQLFTAIYSCYPRLVLPTQSRHTMSSHVVVLDSTARRATIKTTPGKHLADILQEACSKLGADASQYGLK